MSYVSYLILGPDNDQVFFHYASAWNKSISINNTDVSRSTMWNDFLCGIFGNDWNKS